jgi:hypothetical protein
MTTTAPNLEPNGLAWQQPGDVLAGPLEQDMHASGQYNPDQRFTRSHFDTYVQAVLRPRMIGAGFMSEDQVPTTDDALVFLREQVGRSDVEFVGVREAETACAICMDAPADACREAKDLLPALCPGGTCRTLVCVACHNDMLGLQAACPGCRQVCV